jgi:hypothetical protein
MRVLLVCFHSGMYFLCCAHHPFIHSSIHPSTASMHPSIHQLHPCIHPSIHQYPSIHSSMHPSIHPPIHMHPSIAGAIITQSLQELRAEKHRNMEEAQRVANESAMYRCLSFRWTHSLLSFFFLLAFLAFVALPFLFFFFFCLFSAFSTRYSSQSGSRGKR